MDELEKLRVLVGPEADSWTTAQLEQLQQDIETMAALLLDIYRSSDKHGSDDGCGSPNLDGRQLDR
jgi:hypothetical protein